MIYTIFVVCQMYYIYEFTLKTMCSSGPSQTTALIIPVYEVYNCFIVRFEAAYCE